METITEKTTKILDLIIPEGDLDYKVRKILREDIKRKLTEFQLIDNRFLKKYGMTLDEFEKKNIIKIKLSISPTCFIQIYQNIQKGVKSFVVVSGNQRLFGRDCDGGVWHCHPVENPDSHDFSEDGTKEVSLEDFLYEAGERLGLLGIL